MKNIFKFIESQQDKTFRSSIPEPSLPEVSKIEQEETEQIEKIFKKIDSISEKLSEKVTIDDNSKHDYCLDCFLILAIVAIAITLVVVFQSNICVGNDNCDICWCKFVTIILSIVITSVFAIFCYKWKKRIEKKYEKYLDWDLKVKNENLKRQSDVFEFEISILRHLLHRIEFREQLDKLRLDEYARDKDHRRKIDMREQERQAVLIDKVIELGKIKRICKEEKNENEAVKTNEKDYREVKTNEWSLLDDES